VVLIWCHGPWLQYDVSLLCPMRLYISSKLFLLSYLNINPIKLESSNRNTRCPPCHSNSSLHKPRGPNSPLYRTTQIFERSWPSSVRMAQKLFYICQQRLHYATIQDAPRLKPIITRYYCPILFVLPGVGSAKIGMKRYTQFLAFYSKGARFDRNAQL
jgi:hypothetical protein